MWSYSQILYGFLYFTVVTVSNRLVGNSTHMSTEDIKYVN